MQAKYITLALVEFFKNAPSGEYHPFNVRAELGMSEEAWRGYSRAFLYPAEAKAREALAAVGVTIKSRDRRKGEDNPFLVSTFLKKREG